MQRKDVENHAAFIKKYTNNHNVLIRDRLPQGHYVFFDYNGDYAVGFKQNNGVLKGNPFGVNNGKIHDLVANRYYDSIDSFLDQLGKDFKVSLHTAVTKAINDNPDLKKEFSRTQSPLIQELRSAIKKDEWLKVRNYKSRNDLTYAHTQLEFCIDLNDAATIDIICNMVDNVFRHESKGGEPIAGYKKHGYSTPSKSNAKTNPGYKIKQSFADLDVSKLEAMPFPSVKQFLFEHCVNNKSLESERTFSRRP